jgi:hypothetical protein
MTENEVSFGFWLFIMAVLAFALVMSAKQCADCEQKHCAHGTPRMVYKTGCLCVEEPQ